MPASTRDPPELTPDILDAGSWGLLERKSIKECIADGTHLKDCDDDGYCVICGYQEEEDD
jgi:hypothetical protein